MPRLLFFLTCLAVSLAAIAARGANVAILSDAENGPAQFAAGEIAAALQARGDTSTHRDLAEIAAPAAGPRIVLAPARDEAAREALRRAGGEDIGGLREEGFSLRRTGAAERATLWVLGEGPGGVLYGGLELAEQIRLRGFDAVEPLDRNPHLALRGVKFNLPLDLRTPSYSDMGDPAQQNIATVWDFAFWTAFLDALARDRYNFVSLWNLHPFPSMVRVPEYPDVALADVQRSTAAFEEDYPTIATGLVTPEMLRQVETVRRLTIDEKIGFWRRVMAYGRERNIAFYVVTWNIHTYGTGGKYGITDAIENPVTTDYFRRSVRELLLTYPLLAGIGLTTGENMGEASFEAKEAWAFATYGQGVLDALAAAPGRKIRFIHRQHQTRAQDIARTFAPLVRNPDVDFVFSFKYAQAHVLSSTRQTFHPGFVESLGGLKTLWTLRNDDNYLFRWGAPDFVREFLAGMPAGVGEGFHYGSDQWVWGREFLDLEPDSPRQLEVEKHWYQWMLWGRLGYDPSLDDGRLVALLAARFPGAEARALFDAWQHASMIYPLTTGFHWGEFDFQWYIEACRSRPGPAQTASGFHDVNRFITLPPHPGTDNISIPRYVEALDAGGRIAGTTPPQVAEKLLGHAGAALAAIEKIDAGSDKELRRTLADIRAMALLGTYYAHKISGATALALFRKTGDVRHQQEAVAELTEAARAWHAYSGLAATLYRSPIWMNRVGTVDWAELDAEVARDIEIARGGS